tara:strand:- start:23 stop:304 length:282 start_codon:yes stop_codon:yes gene_type:complete
VHASNVSPDAAGAAPSRRPNAAPTSLFHVCRSRRRRRDVGAFVGVGVVGALHSKHAEAHLPEEAPDAAAAPSRRRRDVGAFVGFGVGAGVGDG